MANPFEKYTFEQANQLFGTRGKELADKKANVEYVKGNHWQDGKGWRGPHFEGSGKISKTLKSEIERDFTAKGSARSVVRRKVRGVIGKMPTYQVASRKAATESADTGLIDEANEILNEFWKTARVHSALKKFVKNFETVGEAVFRLFFVQDEYALKPAATIPEAVKRIALFCENPGQGIVVQDKKTLKKASFYRYETNGLIFIEICYVADDGNTVFYTLSRTASAEFAQTQFTGSIGAYMANRPQVAKSAPVALPLNGNLLVFEMTGEALLSQAMLSQQRLIDKAFTMMSHNLDEDGFRQKKILNGLPPGEFKKNTLGQDVYVPNPDGEAVGAGSISYTSGIPIIEKSTDGKIKQTYTTPSVHESEPISITTYTETAAAASEAILEEADQMHISISKDATPSGESRREARESYKSSLEDTKSELDYVVSALFETVLAIVAYLMARSGRYDNLQVNFSAILNAGPVSVEERRAAKEEADDGYRSRESAMEEMNINDPDAMKARIKQEAEENKPTET